MRGGALLLFGTGIGGGSIPRRDPQTSRARSSTFQRRAAAPHLAARRPPRAGGVRLDRLARGGRPAVVADAPARPARPPSLALQGGLRVRRLARPAGRAGRAGVEGRGARLPRARARVDRGLGALRAARGDRRPGPLRPRVGCAARVRGRARREDHRRRPDLRRARQRRPPRAPGAVPGRRRRGHAARRLHRQGPAVGQPALRLAGDAAPRLPLVDRAAGAHVRALRPRPHRPLPRLRRLLGGAGGRAARAQRVVEARAGAGGVRRRGARPRSASCR